MTMIEVHDSQAAPRPGLECTSQTYLDRGSQLKSAHNPGSSQKRIASSSMK